MGANAMAGEVHLTLGPASYTLRPSFACILAAEAELGGMLELAMKASDGAVGTREIVTLLWHCLEPAGGPKPSLQAFGDEILAAGIGQVSGAFCDLLTAILGGDAKTSG